MTVVLASNGVFKTLLEQSVLADVAAPTAYAGTEPLFSAINMSTLLLYWTGTTPSGVIDIDIWVLDRELDTWVLVSTVAALAPNTSAVLALNGAGTCILRPHSKTGAATDVSIRGFGNPQ